MHSRETLKFDLLMYCGGYYQLFGMAEGTEPTSSLQAPLRGDDGGHHRGRSDSGPEVAAAADAMLASAHFRAAVMHRCLRRWAASPRVQIRQFAMHASSSVAQRYASCCLATRAVAVWRRQALSSVRQRRAVSLLQRLGASRLAEWALNEWRRRTARWHQNCSPEAAACHLRTLRASTIPSLLKRLLLPSLRLWRLFARRQRRLRSTAMDAWSAFHRLRRRHRTAMEQQAGDVWSSKLSRLVMVVWANRRAAASSAVSAATRCALMQLRRRFSTWRSQRASREAERTLLQRLRVAAERQCCSTAWARWRDRLQGHRRLSQLATASRSCRDDILVEWLHRRLLAGNGSASNHHQSGVERRPRRVQIHDGGVDHGRSPAKPPGMSYAAARHSPPGDLHSPCSSSNLPAPFGGAIGEATAAAGSGGRRQLSSLVDHDRGIIVPQGPTTPGRRPNAPLEEPSTKASIVAKAPPQRWVDKGTSTAALPDGVGCQTTREGVPDDECGMGLVRAIRVTSNEQFGAPPDTVPRRLAPPHNFTVAVTSPGHSPPPERGASGLVASGPVIKTTFAAAVPPIRDPPTCRITAPLDASAMELVARELHAIRRAEAEEDAARLAAWGPAPAEGVDASSIARWEAAARRRSRRAQLEQTLTCFLTALNRVVPPEAPLLQRVGQPSTGGRNDVMAYVV